MGQYMQTTLFVTLSAGVVSNAGECLVSFVARVGLFSSVGKFMPTTLSFKFSAVVGLFSCAGEVLVTFAARVGPLSCL